MNSITNLNIKNTGKIQKRKMNLESANYLPKKNSQKLLDSNLRKISKLDDKNYNKALLYKCRLKKTQSMPNFKKKFYSKNKFKSLGPYNNLFNGVGGFCKRVENSNYNNSIKLYHYNNSKITDQNIPTIGISRNYNGIKYPIKSHNIRNNIDNKINNIKKNNSNKNMLISKGKKNSKESNKDKHEKKKIDKINIKEVFKNIKYLNLDIDTINNENNIQEEGNKKEINKIKNNKINTTNNNKQKKTFKYKSIEGLSSQTIPNNEKKINKYGKLLIKQSNEQFSMKNNKIKKFSELTEVDSVLLNYFPSFNISKNKNSFTNYSISSNQIEYNIIKQKSSANINKKNKILEELVKPSENKNLILNNKKEDKKNKVEQLNKNDEEKKVKNFSGLNKDKKNPYLDKIIIYKKSTKNLNNNSNNNNTNNKINTNNNNSNSKNSIIDDNKSNNNINEIDINNKNNNVNKTNNNNNINKINNNKINISEIPKIINKINNNYNNIYNPKNNDNENNNFNDNMTKNTEINNKIQEENKEIKEKGNNMKNKNSKQFLKFKNKMFQKCGDEDENVYQNKVSDKIRNLSLELENKLKNSKFSNK